MNKIIKKLFILSILAVSLNAFADNKKEEFSVETWTETILERTNKLSKKNYDAFLEKNPDHFMLEALERGSNNSAYTFYYKRILEMYPDSDNAKIAICEIAKELDLIKTKYKAMKCTSNFKFTQEIARHDLTKHKL